MAKPLPVADSVRGWRAVRHAALLGALLLAGCTTVATPGDTTVSGPAATSPFDPLGASSADLHAQIVQTYGGVYRDAELERTLARIVGRLVAASDDPSRSYRITILNADAINAFALAEGYLYVTRGLLTLAADSSEVAAVLAHEMGHVTADHATQRRDQALASTIVNNVVAGAAGAAGGQVAAATSQQTLSAFSQQQELEADVIGIATIARAGYDPYAASRFLEAMVRFSQYQVSIGLRQGQQSDFLASHPSTPDRIRVAVETAAQFGPPGVGEIDRDRYFAGLDGIVFGDDFSQGFVRGRAFYHPLLAISFGVPEGFVLDNAQSAVLATGGDGTALRFDSVRPAPGETLPIYLSSGWVNGLDPASIRPLTINGLPALSATAMAGGWQFRITLIENGGVFYRFIFANARQTAAFDQAAAAIAGSFRSLSPQEAAAIGPLRVRIVTVRPGDTTQTMAALMRGVDNPLELFLVLNGIEPGMLAPGSTVKIVSD